MADTNIDFLDTKKEVWDTIDSVTDMLDNRFKRTGKPMDADIMEMLIRAKRTLARAGNKLEQMDKALGITETFNEGFLLGFKEGKK